VKAYEVLNNP